MQPFPDTDGNFQLVRVDELVFVILRGTAEVEGAWDQATAYLVSLAILVVVVVVLVAIIVAIVAGLIAAGVVTAGVADALLIPVAIAVIGFLLGSAFTAALSGIDMITAAITGEETLTAIVTSFSGHEIAHRLSSIRFHHILFTGVRPEPASLSDGTERISSSLENGVLRAKSSAVRPWAGITVFT